MILDEIIILAIARWGIKRALQTMDVNAETLERIISKAKSAQEWDIARTAEDELIRRRELARARE